MSDSAGSDTDKMEMVPCPRCGGDPHWPGDELVLNGDGCVICRGLGQVDRRRLEAWRATLETK